MTIPDTNIRSVSTLVQVRQTTMPPPAEMPFLIVPVRKRPAFHYAHSSRHTLLRPIAHEIGSKIYLQEEPICGFWYLNRDVVGLHHTLENGKEMLIRACQQGGQFNYLGLSSSEFYHYHACVLQTASSCHVIPHSNSDVLRYHPQLA